MVVYFENKIIYFENKIILFTETPQFMASRLETVWSYDRSTWGLYKTQIWSFDSQGALAANFGHLAPRTHL